MFSISEKCAPCSSEKRQALFGGCEKSYAGKQAPFLEKMASNASWYPFSKPGDFLRRENRPFSACWGEPQIPRNAPLVRLRILRTLSFCDYRPCDFSLLISSDPTPRIRSTLALAVKSSLISVRALFSAFDTLCPFAIHIVSFCKRNIWIY